MNQIKVRIIICIGTLLVIGCGSGGDNPITKAKNAMKQIPEAVDMIKKVSDSQSTIQKSMDRMQELQNITPVSKEEFKAWLPDDIGSFKRKSYSAGDQAVGSVSSISAKYSDESEENKSFDLNVIDGAGETGGIFALVYIGQFNRDFEEEREDGFSKSVEKDNKKAVVSQDNRFNTSELEYLEGQRYYVKISGNNMKLDELWEVVSKLKTDNLPGL